MSAVRPPARPRAAAKPPGPARPRFAAPRLRPPARLRGHGRDRGTVSIEFLGFLPILLVIGLAVVQLGLAAFAVQQAGTGARAAARTASMDEADHPPAPEAAGRAAMSDWVKAGITVGDGGGSVRATVRVTIPSIIPGVDNFGTASRSATMPRPQEPGALGLAPAVDTVDTYEGAPPR
ncbi:TadE/TadG family type IV pilus assembly protein [Streptomyces sp. DSM 41527]|uniref:TadE/TadG family type IV pilus assembly protein n=1 Tax=Streptomyces mooreae TaxID=3075523 RepID=A0ABU2TCD6_9ACTN|nr:TadE/TadG family type IV pilus assembly protein [Streptomyces sp. DSM 41527]MDT0458603.1 TadE/TadG family type IV pilus assembly protein [Streptomyces sp. DSM 41527]